MKYRFNLVVIFFVFLSCQQGKQDESAAEEKLYNIFQSERDLVKRYEDDYVAYMDYQLGSFTKKNKYTSLIIQKINERFALMEEAEKIEYQVKWQGKFQPLIDEINRITWQMIVNQSKNLSQDKMAQIQVLTTKMKLLEEETPQVELAPQFFVMPDMQEQLLSKDKP